MHRHVCTSMLLLFMMNFNLIKNILFPIFHVHRNSWINHFKPIFKIEIFRVLQFYPLKMNLILKIQKIVIKEIRVFCLWILFTSLSNSTFLVNLPLYFAYPDNLTLATCSTNSKILTGTLNNSQVTPFTRPPFL